jgi:hypothetical protein
MSIGRIGRHQNMLARLTGDAFPWLDKWPLAQIDVSAILSFRALVNFAMHRGIRFLCIADSEDRH